jgi:probable blue pigment (indigoidine) exporter
LWFRGLARLGPQAVSPLLLLSPFTAILLGWLVAGEIFTPLQLLGVALVLVSVWLSELFAAAAAVARELEEVTACTRFALQ